MAVDLLLLNARPQGHPADAPPVDIAVQEGRIVEIAPNLSTGGETLDLQGCFVSPGLIESHIHLDKSRILDRCTPSPNRGRDHMARVSAVKPGFSVEDVYQRASATMEQCLLHGTTHIRTHVEVDPNGGMRGFEALRQLQKDYAWGLDLSLCVFVQEGWSNVPESDANVVTALQNGATVVGGAPGYDPDHGWQIRRIFELAREYDADVDIHLDVGYETDEMDIGLVCELTEQMGLGGRVAIGHGTKYSCLPPAELQALGKRLADVGVTVTVLPATDLFVTGRHQEHTVQRGVADGHALAACGVNCCLSTNNVLNPFTPFGDSSLVRIANLYANVVQHGSQEELAQCFSMVSDAPANLLGLKDYGIRPGAWADLVVWDAASGADAVARITPPRYAFKHGRRTFTRDQPVLHRP